ncbi:class I SAM-dependent methyltransferase [Parafrankia discariae]|uniref:class I SAM-dependent methyltransferase n=1 Tax=Parafrankia discariae TaxID=365528 RepID=UPI0003763A66|nr:class I SAM-dependent methyltransferase [Parafrankia discariae]
MPGPTFGDVDYETHGGGYAHGRRTDPRIASLVHAALADARTVLNVGAGAGSYEPGDRHVLAVEPSAAMRAGRPPHLPPAVNAVAEDLPFDDASVDAAMAMVTVHQWPDPDRGLRELRRVSRGPVVVLTFDPDALDRLWLADYLPELTATERRRFPPIERIRTALGGTTTVTPVPVPADCVDGFAEAFYNRPERFLDPAVRNCQSAWGFLDPAMARRGLARLRADLESGAWDHRHGALRHQPTFTGALRLVTALPAGAGTGDHRRPA